MVVPVQNWAQFMSPRVAPAGSEGLHRFAAGVRQDRALAEQKRAAQAREQLQGRQQDETERARAWTEDWQRYSSDLDQRNRAVARGDKMTQDQASWMKENRGRLYDESTRAAAKAESDAMFGRIDVPGMPVFGQEPAGAQVVEEIAPPTGEAAKAVELSIEDEIASALAGQTGIEEGVIPDEPTPMVGIQDVSRAVSSTEAQDLNDFISAIAGGGQMPPPGMGPPMPAAPQVTPPGAVDLAALPPSAPMGPPGVGAIDMPFGPPDAVPPAAAPQDPDVLTFTTPSGEFKVDYGSIREEDRASAQELANAISAGAPDVAKKASKLLDEMMPALIEQNQGDKAAALKQGLDLLKTFSKVEASMINATRLAQRQGESKGAQREESMYRWGSQQASKQLTPTSMYGQQKATIDTALQGIEDLDSNVGIRQQNAIKRMVMSMEKRVSDMDMRLAQGPMSLWETAVGAVKRAGAGELNPKVIRDTRKALVAIARDGMGKQRVVYDRLSSRRDRARSEAEYAGWNAEIDAAFEDYAINLDDPNDLGFYAPVFGGPQRRRPAAERESKSKSVRASGRAAKTLTEKVTSGELSVDDMLDAL